MKLRGAIFDLDGTLFDSMGMWKSIASSYVKALGAIPEKGLDEKLTSMSLGEAVEYCMDRYGIGGTVPEHMRRIHKRISAFYFDSVQLKPGAAELLGSLAENNVKMCLATATDLRLVEPAVRRTGIFDYFSKIFTCSDVGKSKTDPRIYNVSLEHLGTSKENTPVFEDAYYAALTAKAAGYRVVGIYDENERRHEEMRALCDIYIKDPGKITPELLESIL